MLIGVLKVSVPLSTAEAEMLKHIIQHNRATLRECSVKVPQMLTHILAADHPKHVFTKSLTTQGLSILITSIFAIRTVVGITPLTQCNY